MAPSPSDKPLTPLMENVLKYHSTGRIITCSSHALMQGLRLRGLCSEPTPVPGPEGWMAELNDAGCKLRTKLRIEGAPGAMRIFQETVHQMVVNHPKKRLDQARQDALDGACVFLGSEEVAGGMANLTMAILDCFIDSLEAGTERILVCPECTFTVRGGGPVTTCPEHRVSLNLAVLYPATPDGD